MSVPVDTDIEGQKLLAARVIGDATQTYSQSIYTDTTGTTYLHQQLVSDQATGQGSVTEIPDNPMLGYATPLIFGGSREQPVLLGAQGYKVSILDLTTHQVRHVENDSEAIIAVAADPTAAAATSREPTAAQKIVALGESGTVFAVGEDSLTAFRPPPRCGENRPTCFSLAPINGTTLTAIGHSNGTVTCWDLGSGTLLANANFGGRIDDCLLDPIHAALMVSVNQRLISVDLVR